MLTRIFADNFRALLNFELRPARLSLYLGDNGSGKSTVFNVLGALSDQIVRGVPCSRLFAGTRTQSDKRESQRFELDIVGNGGAYRYTLEIQHPAQPANPFIRSETITFDGNHLYQYSEGEVRLYGDDFSPGPTFPFGRDLSFLPNVDARGTKNLARLAWFKGFLSRIHIIQPNPFDIDLFSTQDHESLGRYGKNLASFFGYLNSERPEARNELEEHLREVFDDFQNLLFKRVGEAKVLMASFLDQNQRRSEYGLHELSEGQRVLLILYASVCGLLRDGSVICFDEPDNFVSLPEIQPWLQTLRDIIGERGGQSMIISHHPEVIDYLAVDTVLRFERLTGVVVTRPIATESGPDLKLSEIVVRGG